MAPMMNFPNCPKCHVAIIYHSPQDRLRQDGALYCNCSHLRFDPGQFSGSAPDAVVQTFIAAWNVDVAMAIAKEFVLAWSRAAMAAEGGAMAFPW